MQYFFMSILIKIIHKVLNYFSRMNMTFQEYLKKIIIFIIIVLQLVKNRYIYKFNIS